MGLGPGLGEGGHPPGVEVAGIGLVRVRVAQAVEHVAVGVGGPQLPLAVAEAQTVQARRHPGGRGYRKHL